MRDQVRMIELPPRYIDGQHQVLMRQAVGPTAQLAAYGIECFSSQDDGKTGVVSDVEQIGKTINGPIGAAQAKQRLEALELPVSEPVDGLILKRKLPFVHGGA